MWFNLVSDFYTKGYYTDEQVKSLVPMFISQQECDKILTK